MHGTPSSAGSAVLTKGVKRERERPPTLGEANKVKVQLQAEKEKLANLKRQHVKELQAKEERLDDALLDKKVAQDTISRLQAQIASAAHLATMEKELAVNKLISKHAVEMCNKFKEGALFAQELQK